jgi:hypothetical protein
MRHYIDHKFKSPAVQLAARLEFEYVSQLTLGHILAANLVY